MVVADLTHSIEDKNGALYWYWKPGKCLRIDIPKGREGEYTEAVKRLLERGSLTGVKYRRAFWHSEIWVEAEEQKANEIINMIKSEVEHDQLTGTLRH